MNEKVCLLIIYNHRYDANIDKLEKIYNGRFTHLYHIIPFYDGNKENVIPVYECSFRFQGYIAQAMKYIKGSFDHYFVVADDLIIHPRINETNYQEWFCLDASDSAYILFSKPLHQMGEWPFRQSFMEPLTKLERYNGTLWKDEILSAEDAFAIAKEKGFSDENFVVDLSTVWKARKWIRRTPRLFTLFFKILLLGKQKSPYPLWCGYSDIFIVPGHKMEDFSHMCGVFAAMNLFVEIAIPTALQLTCGKIADNNCTNAKGRSLWTAEDRDSIGEKHSHSYECLVDNWDDNVLFIHPVKLSGWEV